MKCHNIFIQGQCEPCEHRFESHRELHRRRLQEVLSGSSEAMSAFLLAFQISPQGN